MKAIGRPYHPLELQHRQLTGNAYPRPFLLFSQSQYLCNNTVRFSAPRFNTLNRLQLQPVRRQRIECPGGDTTRMNPGE